MKDWNTVNTVVLRHFLSHSLSGSVCFVLIQGGTIKHYRGIADTSRKRGRNAEALR